MAKYKPMPPFEEVDRLLRYEPETGKLYWKFQPRFGRRIKGAEAGTVHKGTRAKTSYIRINFKKVQLLAHRLAWLLYYKEDPGEKHIDHKNHNGLDNRIGNLRLATNAQNGYNRNISSNSTTGFRGVSRDMRHRSKPYKVCPRLDGKRVFLGNFYTAEEASEAYQRFCKEHHGEFYNQ